MTPIAELPSGTVTFLFTDVEGSTRLLKLLGEGYGDVLAAHQLILRAAFVASDGREIDTQGDSFFVAFGRARDAVAAAVDGQRKLEAHPWPDGAELRVRMGVHTGEPMVGPERYVGLAVHRAARVMAAGHGGQILVTSATRELVEDDLGADMSLRDLGEHQLKDLDRPERLYQVDADGLGSDFPPLRTEDAPTAYSGLEEELAVAAAAIVRPPRVSKRMFLAGVSSGIILVAGLIAVLVFHGGGGAKVDVRVEPNSAAAIDAGTGKVVGSVPVGSGPIRAASGHGALWIVNGDAGTVSRIDPVTKAVVQTIGVGSGPSGIAVGNGAVWVANASDGTLSRIDVDTNNVVQTVRGLQGPRGVAFGEGGIWVALLDDRSVARIDPATGAVVKTIPTGGAPTAIAVGAGSVWVTNEAGSSVLRIDSKTNAITETINVGKGPGAIAVGLGSVWVVNTLDGTVSRINPKTGTGVGLVPVGEGPRDVAVARGAIWVANEFSGTISRIDPRTNSVSASTAIGSRPTGLAVVGSEVWATARPSGGAHRGGTFTFAYPHDPNDYIDSAMSYSSNTLQVLSLTSDGLTAFRRVGGAEGATVVPDLATELPTPTDGGKTYTFQLRDGIRYSTGALVEPRDIRVALERVFELNSPGIPYYSSIVGASACKKGHRCDLSRGIVVAGSTIVFHLVAPDPELLQRLALPFAYAVPFSAPRGAAGTRPLPGTGPYSIVSYDPKQLKLERNPHFHEWSPAARPDGYPDAIVMKFGVSEEAGATAVEQGRLDYAVFMPADRINEVTTRYAPQVHVNTLSATSFFLLNTRVAPFDSQDARRALSYALDRDELVRLAGGPQLSQPTCQILPPKSPGYRPYCPFTSHPIRSGIWQAPNLGLARKLMTRSHTRGTRVTVLTVEGEYAKRVGSYLVRLLDRLGYVASRKVVPYNILARAPVFSGSRATIQINSNEWYADYPSAAAFIHGSFSCGGATNDAGFCAPSIDREMKQAQNLETTDPRAADARWAHIERQLVDAAAWIPWRTPKEIDFVSKRVGNFQFHPLWLMLFDQLWVR